MLAFICVNAEAKIRRAWATDVADRLPAPAICPL